MVIAYRRSARTAPSIDPGNDRAWMHGTGPRDTDDLVLSKEMMLRIRTRRIRRPSGLRAPPCLSRHWPGLPYQVCLDTCSLPAWPQMFMCAVGRGTDCGGDRSVFRYTTSSKQQHDNDADEQSESPTESLLAGRGAYHMVVPGTLRLRDDTCRAAHTRAAILGHWKALTRTL
jgi:hypothetical protein